VENLNAEGTDVVAKITRLQADLDHKAAVQQGREMEQVRGRLYEHLYETRGESKEREALLKQLF